MQTHLDPAIKKAYEVSYALFRIAAILPSRSFAELLEKEALNLLRSTVSNLTAEAQTALGAIHYLVSFGRDTNSIHAENADLMSQQLESLASLLQERVKIGVTPADLSQVFAAAPSTRELQRSSKPRPAAIPASPYDRSVILLKDRQTIILETIRQSGNCRTRDIQAALPDLSERTLRYDLQRLIEEDKIERFGSGPASLYRIKEGGPQSNVSGGGSL